MHNLTFSLTIITLPLMNGTCYSCGFVLMDRHCNKKDSRCIFRGLSIAAAAVVVVAVFHPLMISSTILKEGNEHISVVVTN